MSTQNTRDEQYLRQRALEMAVMVEPLDMRSVLMRARAYEVYMKTGLIAGDASVRPDPDISCITPGHDAEPKP